ncbi:MAG: tRNA uridine-5-carboxymethylaminomethyl(34) synthesis GTPase MnmE [Pelagibacteraceae bacterium]|nr:tRNA uridine-5-carboxymethylaminomethyl(34) synthesis GTPase MnmE [Pelagibacteraceae bacterium]
MLKYNDTIYALSTSTGKSAIDVIRISGNNSLRILKKIILINKIIPNKTNLVILKYKKEVIDQVILTYFKAPKSFTGQDVFEINCHGSPAVVKKISNILSFLGARLAEPGEFTKRALMNNKLNLVQTESLSDLINSETEKQRSLAINNLSGGLSLFVEKINKKLTQLLANTEALIDFSDEDLPKNVLSKIKEQNKNIIQIIKNELKNSSISKPIRQGFVVSLVGKPNTGKSSFVNFISNKKISIVTSIPGTTTDAISSTLDLYGYKFTFMDTAGIRKHKNKIEEIGIKKTKEIISVSDLNLVFLEKNEVDKYKNIKHKIFVKSKLDKRKKTNNSKITNISSVTGEGINKLLKKSKDMLIKKEKNEPIFSRERHIMIMNNVFSILKSIDFNESLDIIAFKYREALRNSLEINQKFDIEDILDVIFKDFCIGK